MRRRTASWTGSPTISIIPIAIRSSPLRPPGTIRAALPADAPDTGESFDAILADIRARHPSGHHALEPPRLLRLFRDHGERARCARGIPLRRAQRAGDALAHVAGRHRTRGGGDVVAAAAARHVRTRSRASSTTRRRSRRCTRSRPRARRALPDVRDAGMAGRRDRAAPSASTAPSRRTRRSTRR